MKTRYIIFMVFIFSLFITNSAVAAENFCNTKKPHPIDIWYENEMKKADNVTVNIRSVQTDAYNKWDKELNRIYKELMSKLKDDDKLLLRETQRNWINFKDSETKYLWSPAMYGVATGNMQTMIISTKLRKMVRNRVCDLTIYNNTAYNF